MSPISGTPADTLTARDETIATDYYWVHDGEHVDRRPALSPDGRWAAWIPYTFANGVQSYRLLVRNNASGVVHDLTTDAALQISSLRWSPDSRSLAFVMYRREAGRINPAEVWCLDIDGEGRRLLYRDENAQGSPGAIGPSLSLGEWSTDGGRIAIGGTIWGGPPPGGGGAWVATDGSGTLTTIPRLTPSECGTARDTPNQYPSPDGSYAICWVGTADLLPGLITPTVNTRNQSLVLYDRASGQTRVLVSNPNGVHFVGFSPEGEWIIFATAAYPEGERMTRFGIIRRDGTGRYDFDALSVSPLSDGRLYFTASASYERPTYSLFALDLTTHAHQSIVADWPSLGILAASSDGQYLLAIRSASGAPRSGYWRDGEIHLLTIRPIAEPGR